MSWTKCDCHDRTYVGRASTLYASMVFRDDKDSKKRKLCPAGLSDLLGNAGRHLVSADQLGTDDVDLFSTCDWCGKERGENGGAAVFLTVYKLGKEREDFAGCVCDSDVGRARQDVFLAI